MATYYAVGTGNWSGSSTTWSTSSGGAASAITPTSSDNVVFDLHSTGTVTVAGTSGTPDNCNNMTMTSPGAGTILMNTTSVLDCYGSWTAATGMTFAPSTGALINFLATSSGQTITHGGYLYSNMTYNGVGGGWTWQDNMTSSAVTTNVITLTNGSLNTNNFSAGATNPIQFSSNNSNTRSLTLGTTTWKTSSANATVWNIATSTGMTLSAASSTINMTGSNTNASFAGGGLAYGTVTYSALNTGDPTVSGANTFSSFSCTTLTTGTLTFSAAQIFTTLTLSMSSGAKNITSGYFLTGNLTVSGTFTTNGNSSVLRNFIASANTGTQYTISAATVSVTQTDFRDIIGTGAGNWNLSAITGGSGDCGGNSGITFSTPKNCYLKLGASANYSVGPWETTSGGSTPISTVMPLPQDSAFCDVNSFSTTGIVLTLNVPRISGISFTGATNTPQFTVQTGGGVQVECYGSMTLISGMTHTGTGGVSFNGRSSYNLDGGGLTWPTSSNITINAPSGTLTLQSTLNSNAGLTTLNGGLALNSYNFVGTGPFTISGGTISGTGTLSGSTYTQSAGTVTLGGDMTLTSTISISGGNLNGTGTISGTTYTQTGGSVALGGTLTLTGLINISSGTLSMRSNAINGVTTFALSGTGILGLSGVLTCSSTITVTGGTISNTGAGGKLYTTGNSLITFSGGNSTCANIQEGGTSNIVVSGTGVLTIPQGGSVAWTTGIFEVNGTGSFNTLGVVNQGTNSFTVGTVPPASTSSTY
jgi:fibronectin-binding autotransporter adhesin